MHRFIRAFWPMLVWMVVVFCMSTNFASSEHTGRIIEPLLRWLDPSLSAEAIARVHFLVRKAGHVTEYGVMALLILRGLRIMRDVPGTRWSWSLAALALCGSAAYGATDEVHQLFVPSRGPSVHDVFIDASGAALALLLAFVVARMRRAGSTPQSSPAS